MWKHKRSWIAKAILRQKIKAGGITLLNFKLYYNAIVIKTVWYWHKNKHIDQWNRTESPHIWSTNLWQQHQEHKMGKNSLHNKWFWENWIATCRRIQLSPYFTPLTKINLKWIKDLNVWPEMVKLLEENIREKLLDIGLGNDFFGYDIKAQATKAKRN